MLVFQMPTESGLEKLDLINWDNCRLLWLLTTVGMFTDLMVNPLHYIQYNWNVKLKQYSANWHLYYF